MVDLFIMHVGNVLGDREYLSPMIICIPGTDAFYRSALNFMIYQR